ncbi:MAG: hypothetical protein IJ225_06870 [Solobacterium sp.]|nr:hypothetical protein [Solobacterium sp.]
MKRRKLRKEVWVVLALCVAGIVLLCLFLFRKRGINPASFSHYKKKFFTVPVEVCADSEDITYEDYRKIDDETSRQYALIHNELKVDGKTGFLYDRDGFLACALGYQFGEVGTRYYVTLESGIVLPLIKTDEKDPKDASDGCKVDINGSVIEFVIDSEIALEYFGTITNGLVLDGNYNNSPYFEGKIIQIERVVQ